MKVKEGDEVKKGDILARLEAGKVALGFQQAQLAIGQAEIRLATVNTNYDRLKKLYDQAVIPKAEFEKIETEKKMTEQAVAQAKTARSLASATWSDATIKAPMDGTVLIKSVEVGDVLSSAQAMKSSPLVVIANLDRMKLQFTVREQYIPYLKKDLKATIRVDAYSHEFSGVVDQVDDYFDPVTRTVRVTVILENQPITLTLNGKRMEVRRPLKIGMFARVTLQLDSLGRRLCVPRRSVISREGMQYVFSHKNGVVTRKNVNTGVTDNDRVEITEGIQVGDEVVIEGQRALYDGQEVRTTRDSASLDEVKKAGTP